MRILVILGTLIGLSIARPNPDIGLDMQQKKYTYNKPQNQLNYNPQTSGVSQVQAQATDQGTRFGAPVEASAGFDGSNTGFEQSPVDTQTFGSNTGFEQTPVDTQFVDGSIGGTSYEPNPSGPAQTFGTDNGNNAGASQFGVDSNGISTASGDGYQFIPGQSSDPSQSQGFGGGATENQGFGGNAVENQGFGGGAVESQGFGGAPTESQSNFGGSNSNNFGSGSTFGGPQQGFDGSNNNAIGLSNSGQGSNVIQGQSSVLNYGNINSGGHHSSGGVRKVIRPVIRAGEPIIRKSFYVHAAPDEVEDENVEIEERVQTVRPEKNYKIIFIKAPSFKTNRHRGSAGSGGAFPPNEEKTIVYVLVNKEESEGGIEDGGLLPTPPPAVTSKPEVYFIKYKTKAEADNFVQNIQNAASHGESAGIINPDFNPAYTGNSASSVSLTASVSSGGEVSGQHTEPQSHGTSNAAAFGSSSGIAIGSAEGGHLGSEHYPEVSTEHNSLDIRGPVFPDEKYLPIASS